MGAPRGADSASVSDRTRTEAPSLPLDLALAQSAKGPSTRTTVPEAATYTSYSPPGP